MRLLAGSMVLSNVDGRLSNVDEPKMFTVISIQLTDLKFAKWTAIKSVN